MIVDLLIDTRYMLLLTSMISLTQVHLCIFPPALAEINNNYEGDDIYQSILSIMDPRHCLGITTPEVIVFTLCIFLGKISQTVSSVTSIQLG